MRWTSLSVLLILLSGCVAPIQATRNLPQPRTLSEVNALLDEHRSLTVELSNGERIRGVRDAIVEADALRFPRYSLGRQAETVAIPIEQVERITYVRNRGTSHGAAVGAVPLAVGLGVGVAGALGDSGEVVSGGLWFAIFAATGAVVSLATVPLGAWVGQAASPGGVVPLYQGPVERYQDVAPLPAAPSDG